MNMVRGACIAVAVAAALGAHADPEGFGAKQTITFSGYDGTAALENFPALIRLSSVYFRQADGSDVVVTDAGGNILPHEVDSVMDGKVLVWVRVPSLSGTATSVTAWFGKDDVTQSTLSHQLAATVRGSSARSRLTSRGARRSISIQLSAKCRSPRLPIMGRRSEARYRRRHVRS